MYPRFLVFRASLSLLDSLLQSLADVVSVLQHRSVSAAMDTTDLVQWVSDQLHDILGLSDTVISNYLVAEAKKSASGDAFVQKLKKTKALKISDKVSSFALELWNKAPHKKAVDPYQASREKERAAIVQQQKSKGYKLLSDDDDDDKETERHARKKAARKEKERGKERKARRAKMRGNIRKGRAESESSEEEEKPAMKRNKADSDSDEWDR